MKDVLNKILEKINLKKKVLEPQLWVLHLKSNKHSGVWAVVAYTRDEALYKSAEGVRNKYPHTKGEKFECTMEDIYSFKEIIKMFDEYSEEGDIIKQLTK